jgi:hypothetical protein
MLRAFGRQFYQDQSAKLAEDLPFIFRVYISGGREISMVQFGDLFSLSALSLSLV